MLKERLDEGLASEVRVHVVLAGMSVGHAGWCSLLHEMFVKAERAAMTVVDFQLEGCPGSGCRFGAGPVSEAYSSHRSDTPGKTQLLDGLSFEQPDWGAEVGKRRVCTMVILWEPDRVVCGPDRAGLEIFFGGVADFEGLEPGSSPTSGTQAPSSGVLFMAQDGGEDPSFRWVRSLPVVVFRVLAAPVLAGAVSGRRCKGCAARRSRFRPCVATCPALGASVPGNRLRGGPSLTE